MEVASPVSPHACRAAAEFDCGRAELKVLIHVSGECRYRRPLLANKLSLLDLSVHRRRNRKIYWLFAQREWVRIAWRDKTLGKIIEVIALKSKLTNDNSCTVLYPQLLSLAIALSFFRFEDPALFFDRILTSSIIKKWFFATAHRHVEWSLYRWSKW
jgi:hypothetical protein